MAPVPDPRRDPTPRAGVRRGDPAGVPGPTRAGTPLGSPPGRCLRAGGAPNPSARSALGRPRVRGRVARPSTGGRASSDVLHHDRRPATSPRLGGGGRPTAPPHQCHRGPRATRGLCPEPGASVVRCGDGEGARAAPCCRRARTSPAHDRRAAPHSARPARFRGAEKAATACELLGGRIDDVVPNPSSPIDRVGFVVIMAKIAATSPRFPRRSGVPARTPLGQQRKNTR